MRSSIKKRFGAKLRRLRDESGWTQEELCSRTGIGREHISRLENGQKEAGLVVIESLASAFRISVEELMSGV